jgi:hypothetical protein
MNIATCLRFVGVCALIAAAAESYAQSQRAPGMDVYCQQTPDGRMIPQPYGGTRRQIPCGPNFRQGTPAPTPPARETSDCRTANRPGTVLVLQNALEVVRCIFVLYNSGFPILIGRAEGFAMPTCVVLLSGTEPTNWQQATSLPEDIAAAFNDSRYDRYYQSILNALIDMRNRGICRQARLIMAGHSLGGMEAQNLAVDPRVRDAGFSIGDVVTFGSPATVELPRFVPRERFATIGDTMPYSTLFTRSYRPVDQTIVSDLQGPSRYRAIAAADRQRPPPGSPVDNYWIWLLVGAIGPHMDYPNVMELADYDAIGKPIRTGTILRLRDIRRYSASRQ